MPDKLLTVAETSIFIRQASMVWDDIDRGEFIEFIAANPDAGDIIPGTGGVRKIRWARQGQGKRGGVRVIYFYHDPSMPLYLLLIYAKARKEDLSPEEKRIVSELASILKGAKK